MYETIVNNTAYGVITLMAIITGGYAIHAFRVIQHDAKRRT